MTNKLANLEILTLDCQATGANPKSGHLLEIGWYKTRASDCQDPADHAAQSYLIKLPPQTQIPRAVQRVTGISLEDMAQAISPEMVAQKLDRAAAEVAAANRTDYCSAIIHFARFEGPFLRNIFAANDTKRSFPFQIICTHEIARRLLPDLPRRGLRALAGYFGHSVAEHRRSAEHVVATAVIWKNLVKLLQRDHGIHRIDQLLEWLQHTKPPARSGRAFPMDSAIRQALPDQPGVYRMLRSNGSLLYIGKAKSLKKRVKSYFRPKSPLAEHTLEMISQASDLDVTITHSALEAAVLESDEIKRHSPPYNIALQGRQRKLAFCTRNLKEYALKADKDHRIGPLPAEKPAESLSALGKWLTDGFDKSPDGVQSIGIRIMGLSEEYAPEPECLQQGLEMFQRKYRHRLKTQPPLRALTAIGARLWRERLEAMAQAALLDMEDEVDENEEDDELPPEAFVWSPEAVEKATEGIFRHIAHLIRRARWFCMLSEATLGWGADQTAGGQKADSQLNVIVFSSGNIIRRDKCNPSEMLPLPPGCVRPFGQRQKSFDLMTYDRLRIVTTELRRLIAEKRSVMIRLGPKTILYQHQLEKVLRWV